jgi:hypothetical protein
MTLALFLLCTVAIIVVAIGAAFFQRRRESRLPHGWTTVDMRAMSRLLSAEDDAFLAENLPWFVLFHLRIKRAIAAADYLSRLRDNSRYAVAVARLQKNDSLMEAATSLRIEIAKLQFKAWLGVIAPLDADIEKLDGLTRVFANPRKLSAVPVR